MAQLGQEESSGGLAVPRLSLNQFEQLIGLYPAEQQADLWHSAAEAFENDENHPERWDRAIICYQNAAGLSDGKESKPIFLSHLSLALLGRASLGISAERDTRLAVDAAKEAMDVTHRNDPYYKVLKANYGETMLRLYQESRTRSDFEAGCDAIKDAIRLAGEEDVAQIELWYGKLRQELFRRAESTGTLQDLNEALDAFGEDTPNFQDDPEFQFYFAVLLQARHLVSGSSLDIIHSVGIVDHLFGIDTEDENYGSILSFQANNLRILAQRTKEVEDCNKAIDLLDKTVAWSEKHGKLNTQNRAILLGSKATTLLRRYDLSGEDEKSKAEVPSPDLDLAIELSKEAADLASIKVDSVTGNLLGTLGAALLSRYVTKMQSPTDLEAAVSAFRRALDLQTKVFHAQSLSCLGSTLRYRAERTDLDSDWELAFQAYEKGAACLESPIYYRLTAADDGGKCIFHRDPIRAFNLFEKAVEFLPLLSPGSLSLVDREHNLAHFDNIAWSAASACLEATGNVYQAIRLAEIGRGVIPSLRINHDADISALEEQHEKLAKEFRLARSELSSVDLSFEDSLSYTSSKVRDARLQTEKFNSVLCKIRSEPGFESFLDCPTESELRDLARPGALVLFSATRFRTDALLVTKDGLKSVALPKLKYSDVLKYAEQFIDAITTHSVRKYAEANRKMKGVLAWLWDVAVCQVLEELGNTTMPQADEEWPQIWWVRSGIFSLLPLHAAGYHDTEPRISAIDRVISSYTPTIKSLLHARRSAKPASSEEQKILVIGMPKTPGQDDLLPVVQEVEELRDLFPPMPVTTIRMNPTCGETLRFLEETDIFHFSGHGLSSIKDPLMSCLLMQDWESTPLTILKLLRLDTLSGRFAYLSACHSGSSPNSGFSLVDESLHISSAFQLVGFRTVVATLWYCYADHSKTIASQLYQHMLDESRIVFPERSAVGLHHAVRALRDDLRKIPGMRKLGPDNPLIWAAYIHTGA
jgi:tetratricopeptide (TPR) repeat protein